MINYVIINGVNSNTINGLGINELPPITKPQMRAMQEEIDGRDGDITTNLGYSAYDKTITIGLFGTGYDINDIVAFFNGEGTIVFSNEADKFYNFKILNQIDYVALQKFKSASITFHCQPFKYPLTETPLEIEYTYIEDEGESLTLNNTGEATLKLDLLGNTSQTGTPTPSSPIPVNVVSGDNEINVCGKNLLNSTGASSTTSGITFTNNGDGTYTANGTATAGINFALTNLTTTPITLEANQQYTQTLEIISGTFGGSIVPAFKNSGGTITYNYFNCNGNSRTDSKTPTEKMIAHTYNLYLGSGVTISNCTFRVQLEKGTSTPYEPYQSQTYEVDLGTLELCKIGDYQDYFTKNSGKNLLPNTQLTQTINGVTLTNNNDGTYSLSGTATAQAIFKINPLITELSLVNGGTYTYSSNKSLPSGLTTRLEIYNGTTWKRAFINDLNNTTQYRTGILDTTDADIVRQSIIVASGTTINIEKIGLMLNEGSTTLSYEPYGTGQWCKYNAIGKVVLDGSETGWGYYSTYFYLPLNTLKWQQGGYRQSGISNRFIVVNRGLTNNGEMNLTNQSTSGVSEINLRNDDYNRSTINDFKTWLSNNNVSLYYPTTPYLSLIEDNNLIEQLDNIQNAMSYQGTTNISQVNNDKPFIISVKAVEEGTNEVVVNNIGNAYSKPLIALEGSGNVDIYLDNTQILKANVEDKMNIDIAKLEAYNPDTSALLNRQVIGNYNTMTLQPGESTIRIDGALDKATISNYTRWL